MVTDRTLSPSPFPAIIHVPIRMINIADPLFNLPDAEYQRCSHAHIAAAQRAMAAQYPSLLKQSATRS